MTRVSATTRRRCNAKHGLDASRARSRPFCVSVATPRPLRERSAHLGRLGFFAFGWRLVVASPAPLAPTPRPTRGAVVAADASSSSSPAVVGEPGSSDAACLPRTETCRARASERDSRGAFFRDALEVRASSTTPEDRDARRARYTPAATPTTAAVVAASHHDVSPRTARPIWMLHARGELAKMWVEPDGIHKIVLFVFRQRRVTPAPCGWS